MAGQPGPLSGPRTPSPRNKGLINKALLSMVNEPLIRPAIVAAGGGRDRVGELVDYSYSFSCSAAG